MELYLIRHGQSSNNALQDRDQRLPDPHLTDLGQAQAAMVAQYVANGPNIEHLARTVIQSAQNEPAQGYGITKLYCSAMYRAMQTTKPIGEELGIAPEIWFDVHEYGGVYLKEEDEYVNYPGKTRAEILAEFPTYILPDEVTDSGWWYGGREDWALCHGRAIRTARALYDRANSDERIAIVSHGGFIDVLLKALLHILPAPHVYFHLYNTSITRVAFAKTGRYVDMVYINRVNHLPPELMS
ncbi:histidine phosphatase family protein [Anaerolineales bacterium HSG6]|nr:histidine phosphatase family protein [Anaerolineales bacterium HSG6]MDM8533036.1 histidine phosphatase family protein [Anaerolineales bacterium HSG25]